MTLLYIQRPQFNDMEAELTHYRVYEHNEYFHIGNSRITALLFSTQVNVFQHNKPLQNKVLSQSS